MVVPSCLVEKSWRTVRALMRGGGLHCGEYQLCGGDFVGAEAFDVAGCESFQVVAGADLRPPGDDRLGVVVSEAVGGVAKRSAQRVLCCFDVALEVP